MIGRYWRKVVIGAILSQMSRLAPAQSGPPTSLSEATVGTRMSAQSQDGETHLSQWLVARAQNTLVSREPGARSQVQLNGEGWRSAHSDADLATGSLVANRMDQQARSTTRISALASRAVWEVGPVVPATLQAPPNRNYVSQDTLELNLGGDYSVSRVDLIGANLSGKRRVGAGDGANAAAELFAAHARSEVTTYRASVATSREVREPGSGHDDLGVGLETRLSASGKLNFGLGHQLARKASGAVAFRDYRANVGYEHENHRYNLAITASRAISARDVSGVEAETQILSVEIRSKVVNDQSFFGKSNFRREEAVIDGGPPGTSALAAAGYLWQFGAPVPWETPHRAWNLTLSALWERSKYVAAVQSTTGSVELSRSF